MKFILSEHVIFSHDLSPVPFLIDLDRDTARPFFFQGGCEGGGVKKEEKGREKKMAGKLPPSAINQSIPQDPRS